MTFKLGWGYSWGSKSYEVSTSPDECLAPNRQWAITWMLTKFYNTAWCHLPTLGLSELYKHYLTRPSLVQIKACCLFAQYQTIIWTHAGFLSIGPWQTYVSEIWIKIQQFSLMKMSLKCSLQTGSHFVLASMCYIGKWSDMTFVEVSWCT